LEPGLVWVEKWGAVPDEIPTAIVAVAYPQRERARLRLAGALMGPNRGNVSVVSVFRLEERLDEASVQSYYGTIEERNTALRAESDLVTEFGATVDSHVVVSTTAFRGLVTAAETTRATLLLIGWPGHGPQQPEEALAWSLDRHVRTHLVLFREAGAIPARRILVLMDETIHGDLSLLVASRLTAAWGADLTVATVIPSTADEETRIKVEDDLEAELGVSIRAAVRAIPASSPVEALREEANRNDLLILGVSSLDEGSVEDAVERLAPLEDCSLALVRAHPEASLEARRRP
jgi:hypothetical protein